MAYIHTCFLAFMLIASLLVPGSFATGRGGDYGPKEHGVTEKSKVEEEKLLSTNNIGIQGIVYCKSSSKLIPVEGALTRITCEAVDEYGFETRPFTFLSEETDSKGYFLAMLSPREVAEKWVLKECRAFLDASPLNNCSYPTDFNKGISGAVLHSPRFLHDKKMKLYTVGPFLFTSSPTSISDGY
ncbi:Proline-rich protein 3 [Spatholobus suberectus]|nr:Proline-rich protein 3 [Spatholobus suberectus]